MTHTELFQAILEKLVTVIDPETGVDVLRMKLVKDLTVDPDGKVTYIFRPSSPLCPIAVPLALAIIQVIKEVPGVTAQSVTVTDYVQADQLNDILLTILED
ncbi:MAG TPA: iron-sulfur cluster assembly protein [Anaerolineaceae bacterium]|nr:iron-sulfur cluster assembly protein [Anaerolineaceae bacterium]